MPAYVLSPEAVDDLHTFWNFIAADSEQAADRMIDELFDAFTGLARWPHKGHRRPDVTRRDVLFWPEGDFLIVYRPSREPLQIAAILHGARDIPRIVEAIP